MDDMKKKVKQTLKEKAEHIQESELGKKIDEHMGKMGEKLEEKFNQDETLQKVATGILKRVQKVQESLNEANDIFSGSKELAKRTGQKVLKKIEEVVSDGENAKK